MNQATLLALRDRLCGFEPLVEVGIGRRTALAETLADAGKTVFAVDLHPQEVPDGVTFVRDDVTDPDPEIYAGADAIYALNLPPELHRPVLDLARTHDAAFFFTTLGTDQPEVSVERETIPGDTLFRAQ